MEFDTTFGRTEPGPGKNRQAEIDGGSIERVELVLNRNFFLPGTIAAQRW